MPSPDANTPADSPKQAPRPIAILSLGLRPFFLGAALFAIVAILLWLLTLQGITVIEPSYGMSIWHRHEMLFGYGTAVLAGFLMTAVPNWTGGAPLSGARLGALWLVWLAGRGAMMLGAPDMVVMVLDIGFLPLIALVVGRDIVAARNWRNLMVLGPILLVGAGNAIFHYEASAGGVPEYGTRLGLAGLVFLVMLIGGRIIPAFSRNWLVKQGSKRLPTGFGRFDAVVLLVSLVILGRWVLVPVGQLTGVALGLVVVLHLIRLSRWAGLATWPNPLLFVLHGAYAMIPAGLGLMALAAWLDDGSLHTAALHLLAIGVIGAMTLAVMSRASLGHTGRALLADKGLQAGLVFIFISAMCRVLAEFSGLYMSLITLSALFWMAGFALFVARIGPGLVAPNPE